MTSHKFIYDILNQEELDLISEEIGRQEKITSGEIRVSVREKRKLLEKKKTLKELAEAEFKRLKMVRTQQRNGILLFILLKEKQFFIYGDIGISAVIKQEKWNEIAGVVEGFFREGKFYKGIVFFLRECGQILKKYFPYKSGDINELDNKVELS